LQPNGGMRRSIARLKPSRSVFVFESDRALEPSPRPYRRLAQIVLETRKSFPEFPEIVREPAGLGASGGGGLELRPCGHIQHVVDVIVDDSFVRMQVRMHVSCDAASRAASRAL